MNNLKMNNPLYKIIFDNMQYIHLGRKPEISYIDSSKKSISIFLKNIKTLSKKYKVNPIYTLSSVFNKVAFNQRKLKNKKIITPSSIGISFIEKSVLSQIRYQNNYLLGEQANKFIYSSLGIASMYSSLGSNQLSDYSDYKDNMISSYINFEDYKGKSEDAWSEMIKEDGLDSILSCYLLIDTYCFNLINSVKSPKEFSAIMLGKFSKNICFSYDEQDIEYFKLMRNIMEKKGFILE